MKFACDLYYFAIENKPGTYVGIKSTKVHVLNKL